MTHVLRNNSHPHILSVEVKRKLNSLGKNSFAILYSKDEMMSFIISRRLLKQ